MRNAPAKGGGVSVVRVEANRVEALVLVELVLGRLGLLGGGLLVLLL
jgi:hypothetical protein